MGQNDKDVAKGCPQIADWQWRIAELIPQVC
jgi:hypothetical protein